MYFECSALFLRYSFRLSQKGYHDEKPLKHTKIALFVCLYTDINIHELYYALKVV